MHLQLDLLTIYRNILRKAIYCNIVMIDSFTRYVKVAAIYVKESSERSTSNIGSDHWTTWDTIHDSNRSWNMV
jgi:hypothetical protein